MPQEDPPTAAPPPSSKSVALTCSSSSSTASYQILQIGSEHRKTSAQIRSREDGIGARESRAGVARLELDEEAAMGGCGRMIDTWDGGGVLAQLPPSSAGGGGRGSRGRCRSL
ncbi:hypothetical protein ABZP36_009684 [Zizania latifolia]